MKQENFHCSINADVTIARAYASIANVGAWWAKNFKGSALHTGDSFTVQFGETKVVFEITEAIPDKRIVWKVTDCYLPWLKDKTEWNNTQVVWELSQVDGKTKIDMTHIGLTPEVECYEDCRKGWTGHITVSLLKLMAEGVGQPE